MPRGREAEESRKKKGDVELFPIAVAFLVIFAMYIVVDLMARNRIIKAENAVFESLIADDSGTELVALLRSTAADGTTRMEIMGNIMAGLRDQYKSELDEVIGKMSYNLEHELTISLGDDFTFDAEQTEIRFGQPPQETTEESPGGAEGDESSDIPQNQEGPSVPVFLRTYSQVGAEIPVPGAQPGSFKRAVRLEKEH